MSEAKPTLEDVLDLLSVAMADLDSLRAKIGDQDDRAALNSQIMALSKWWHKLDVQDFKQDTEALVKATESLGAITGELKKQKKKKLSNVAGVIQQAARAIAVAEKVAKAVLV